MTLFLLTFFFLYGCLHLYAFMKARAAFPFGHGIGLLIACCMIGMIVSPVIVRLSEKAGHDLFARVLSYVGYLWMGVLFLFVSIAFLMDIYRLAISGAGLVLRRDMTFLGVGSRAGFLVPLVAAFAITLYGWFEAKAIRTEHLTIRSPKIPPTVDRVRIVQISDVHLGLIVREARLGRILKAVEEAKPDIFVSTGDLVDGQIDDLTVLAEMLRGVPAPYGKFAVTGNHEFYAGLRQSIQFTEDAGFTMLRGERVPVTDFLTIAGVDDSQATSFGISTGMSERELLGSIPNERFVIMLKHRPLVDTFSRKAFDLQLSGHVHRGQIFPFSLITALYYETQDGLRIFPERSRLYVSRGSGTWGPPIRFLSPPEVTVIDIVGEGT